MHDDRHEGVHGGGITAGAPEQDTLAALINAAGKRATPPDAAYRQVRTAAHDAWQAKLASKRDRARHLALAAGVAIVAVGAAAILQLVPRNDPVVLASSGVIQGEVLRRDSTANAWLPLAAWDSPIIVGTQIRTTDTGRIALDLPANGSLRIDADSEVTIASTAQFVLAAGTLYVDSGGATLAEPFTVTTPFGTVRDVGTQFEVATEPQSLRVRVRDGAVSIAGSSSPAEVFGSAGEQLRVSTFGTVDRDVFAPYDPAWAWVEMLAATPQIEGQSLHAFLDWVARETGRELRFDAPLTETRARGVVLHGDAADLLPLEALEVVLSTTDFAYVLRADGAILVRERT